MTHPEVQDAGVVGVANPELGEEVKAVIQRTPGSAVSSAELQAWVGETLANFKVPSIIEFSDDALPRTPSGKLIKAALRGEGQDVFEENF